MRTLSLVLLSVGLYAHLTAGEAIAESKPAATPALPAPAVAVPPAGRPDPTAAVVAEARYLYRQRDLDALMTIALRHAKGKVAKVDEERMRQSLLMALTAREPLMQALALLPPSYPAKSRDALLLDLLDYQAEPAKPPTAPPTGAPVTSATDAAPTAVAPAGPILVRLPPLTVSRSLENVGKRSLTIGLALIFTDPALSKTMEAKAPIIQDAILGYAHQLTPAQIADPDQIALKAGFAKAIAAKVPGFPADGVLIPQLDTGDAPAAGAER